MDDDISHEGPAYNRDLAEVGYLIELIASDGFTTTIDSQTAFYNRKILVAYLVDDSALPDKYFPLRLVGEDLEKSQRVGALAEIRLLLDEDVIVATEEPAGETVVAEPPAAPPAGTAIWITGQVASALALNDTGVRALEVVHITAEHPKKGEVDYEGVYLNTLLALANPIEGAVTIQLEAADGYSASLDLAAVQACSDCLLALTESEGIYQLVMPGFESSAWIKEIVKIEVK
jgi:DMSO/TMAO reductase YedYZ molybdopterin-dependent catalytic subunit